MKSALVSSVQVINLKTKEWVHSSMYSHSKRSDDGFFQAYYLKDNKNQCFNDKIKQILPYFQVELGL